jgi:hypothetical protein
MSKASDSFRTKVEVEAFVLFVYKLRIRLDTEVILKAVCECFREGNVN